MKLYNQLKLRFDTPIWFTSRISFFDILLNKNPGMPNHDFDRLIKGEQYRQFLQQNPQPEFPVNIEFYKRDEISSDNVPE